MLHSVTQILRSGEAKNVLGHPPTVEELHDAYLVFRQCYRAPIEEPVTGKALSVHTPCGLPCRPAQNRAVHRHKKRLMSMTEERANKSKASKTSGKSGLPLKASGKAPPSCTFCRDTKHRNPHCPKKKGYGQIIKSEGKQAYLNHLKERCPIHSKVVGINMLMSSFTRKTWKHLQVKSIHPTVTTNDESSVPSHLLAAKIAIIGGQYNDILPFAAGTSNKRFYAYITMTSLESTIHQTTDKRLIFDRTGDDSMGSLYRPRDDPIPNRQAERYTNPSHHTIPVQTIVAAPGRTPHLYSRHSFPQHPLQRVMYQNQYQNSNLHHHGPLVQNDNRIQTLPPTHFSPYEHYKNGVTNSHAGVDGIQNAIPTTPFHLRNFH